MVSEIRRFPHISPAVGKIKIGGAAKIFSQFFRFKSNCGREHRQNPTEPPKAVVEQMDGGESSRQGEAFFGDEGDRPRTVQAPDRVCASRSSVDSSLIYDEVGGIDGCDEMGAGLDLMS